MRPETLVLVGAAAFGAALGSFLNVCIYRLPRDQSLVRPRSRCPGCEAPVAWYDNVPVLSWMVLGGRCRRCRSEISMQYPLIEALVALLWLSVATRYGFTWQTVAAGVFGTILLGIAVTDARHYLIPDEYTIGGLILGLALSLRGGWAGLGEALLGAGVGLGLLYAVAWAGTAVFKKEAMGGGDIKMMAMVGAFVGWKGVLLTIFGGALLGTVVFVPISLRTKKLVPFGVFLATAAAITFVWGDAIIAWYAGLVRGG